MFSVKRTSIALYPIQTFLILYYYWCILSLYSYISCIFHCLFCNAFFISWIYDVYQCL